MKVQWAVQDKRLELTELVVEHESGHTTSRVIWDYQLATSGTDMLWGLPSSPVAKYESWPGAGKVSERITTPRFVDELSYEEQATPLTEARAIMVLSAQLVDRRRWVDEGFHAVNNDMVVIGLESAKGHILVVKAWRAGWYQPGQLGRWQRFRMERFEAESFIDLGGHGQDRAWYDTDEGHARSVQDALAEKADEAAELGFKWAAQLQQQLAYDLEGTGWDGQGDVVKWDNPTRLKAPESVTPRPGAHPGWDRPPTKWTVTKLPKSRVWQSSPFAGMRNVGTDPGRFEAGSTAQGE